MNTKILASTIVTLLTVSAVGGYAVLQSSTQPANIDAPVNQTAVDADAVSPPVAVPSNVSDATVYVSNSTVYFGDNVTVVNPTPTVAPDASPQPRATASPTPTPTTPPQVTFKVYEFILDAQYNLSRSADMQKFKADVLNGLHVYAYSKDTSNGWVQVACYVDSDTQMMASYASGGVVKVFSVNVDGDVAETYEKYLVMVSKMDFAPIAPPPTGLPGYGELTQWS